MSADIFVSYARAERDIAEPIARRLQSHGLRVFFDVDRLESGDVFSDRIDREVKGAGMVLGLWSPYSLSRPWVRTECDIGRARNVLVPAIIKPISDMDVPAPFWNVQYVDLTQLTESPLDPNWIQLVKSIARCLGRTDLLRIEASVGVEAAPLGELDTLISSKIDARIRESEERAAEAIGAMRKQFLDIAQNIKNEHEQALSSIKAGAGGEDDVAAFASRIEQQLISLEHRSADAITSIGEQVALVVERLQKRHDEAAAALHQTLQHNFQAQIDDIMSQVIIRLSKTDQQNLLVVRSIQTTVSDLGRRVSAIESPENYGPKRFDKPLPNNP